MNTKTKWMSERDLELISDSVPELISNQRIIPLWLGKIWNFLVNAVTEKPGLKAWLKYDRNGNPYWRIYDPKTDRFIHLASEQEVGIWIEESYYRRDRVVNHKIYQS